MGADETDDDDMVDLFGGVVFDNDDFGPMIVEKGDGDIPQMQPTYMYIYVVVDEHMTQERSFARQPSTTKLQWNR